MGTKVALHHRTSYRYDKPVALGPQVVKLRPGPQCRTPILSYSLKIAPAQHFLHWQQDPHGNSMARVVFPEKIEEFVIDVDVAAEIAAFNPFDFFLEPGTEEYPFEYSQSLARDLQAYRSAPPAGPLLQRFLGAIGREKRETIGLLVDLNQRVSREIGYVARLDPGIQSCEETLARRTGSCRDSAWLLVQALRHLGIAARFVSGYLIQLADDPGAGDGAHSTDSADLHAWAEAFLPGAGWIGLDPTSGLLAGEGHLPLASSPEALDAAPVGGTVEPAKVDFSYSLSIRRLNEVPSVSRPFTDEAWARLEEVARKVDADLAAQDVRLTMGGEPTFVGIDNPESPEWNIAALGAAKRARGLSLIQCLREKIAPGALLHYGQGKWYPGEPLPRWALSCYWRRDGVPVWENLDLIAREDQKYGFADADARQFIQALSRRLQVDAGSVLPAYNDEAGSTEPAGYVLPIRRRQHQGKLYWSSQLWFPRPERLLLLRGDSPIGYRLPVEALPWVAPDELEYAMDEPPFAQWPKLPSRPSRRMDLFDSSPWGDPLPPLAASAESATEMIRPSLCVQAREGRLHLSLPYASRLADYLEMVAAVEDTCQYLQKPVWIEGYAPPVDPRQRSFSITPDPGVLEVNLPPASSWDELVQINTLLFEQARTNGLTAEKFTHDGRHTATGGGNHIVIGGASASDSPLLRRPGLLRSMVAFWQNHPSLSYLFSGMFIGPTSQYPRVDEARMDALYELEVAFSQLPSGECSPSIVDGLFRNLLVDMTGNTHRAEFCIDKLYPPPGHGLQLGLLELRAFEMTPHVKMGLAQALLIRALVSMFWSRPFEGNPVRWATALHDRFLLPHFLQQDFFEVLGLLRRFGYAFERQWFAAHLEFRFPRIGSVSAHGLELELRQALEPWHVLAEETNSGGTVRSVDSSLERLQVKLSGLPAADRYAVSCNGRRIPLHPAGSQGEAVGGLRYRARQLASSLHPTIPVHAPLEFEILDEWNEQPIVRCRYHMTPPNGREYSSRPASAAEAEARRRERFEVCAPRSRYSAPPHEEVNPIFPMTLDLRWPQPSQPTRVKKTEPAP
ncbi:MAG TPA: transglutaminase family protein [Acidobacteriaceae bacterium]|nr:transglutaminase family protein [Acidobacteriaceae bacterium]